jgi:hypothetical protein
MTRAPNASPQAPASRQPRYRLNKVGESEQHSDIVVIHMTLLNKGPHTSLTGLTSPLNQSTSG